MRISRSRHLTGPAWGRRKDAAPAPLSVRVPVLCLPCTELCAVSQAWNLLSWGQGGGVELRALGGKCGVGGAVP